MIRESLIMVLLKDEEIADAPYHVDVLLVVSANESSASGQGMMSMF